MKKLLQEFKEFALRGNVMDLAVGVIIGSAFTAFVVFCMVVIVVSLLLLHKIQLHRTFSRS